MKARIFVSSTGLIFPIINILIQINICIIIIQTLLIPTLLEKKFKIFISSKGAHKNLRAYGIPTKANRPIVVLFTPRSANHVPKVAEVNNNGNPEKKPTGKKISNLFLKQFLRSLIKILIFYNIIFN